MTRRLLVAVDGSEPSIAALRHALDMFDDAELTAIHAIDELEAHYGGGSGADGGDPDFFEAIEEIAADSGSEVETRVVTGAPADAIIGFAERESVDGIVVGSEGRSGVSRMLLGSVAESIARRSPVPVTIVR